ncbi:UrcA family protein [Sphingomonas sp. LHG3406-1]|uniref:UrcA family protein n=1 Tax=Sphingomonas sp. LHG3406-1 TaxID=2804617 RepID=UPI002639F16C|nr:UrcA family protein [Sphingomonas sp. LHG3406-1]
MSSSLKSTGLTALAFSASFGLIAIAIAPATAFAQSPDISITAPYEEEALSKRVAIGDLDLAKPRDMKRLDARIRSASRAVCEPNGFSLINDDELQCRKVAVASAQPQVARLRDQALSLAAAGQPSRIDTTLAVVAPDAE